MPLTLASSQFRAFQVERCCGTACSIDAKCVDPLKVMWWAWLFSALRLAIRSIVLQRN